jgi:hypothetical protein
MRKILLVAIAVSAMLVSFYSSARRSPALRNRPRRSGFARLAQEAEGAGGPAELKLYGPANYQES